jgi:hypothetical protein
MRWTQQLGPVKSLTRFTQLGKIVAHQEAFSSADESFTVCESPTSVEEIGVLNTTCARHRWLQLMLENKWKYPNLKVITFCGHESWKCSGCDVLLA